MRRPRPTRGLSRQEIIIKIIIIIIINIVCYHIHSYLPDTNHASKADNAAAVLPLQCTVHVVVLPVINLS